MKTARGRLALVFAYVLLSSEPSLEAQGKHDSWLDLVSGRIHGAGEKVKPLGPIVWGWAEKEGFVPSHEIDFGNAATPPDPKLPTGWIELRTGAIHRDLEGRAPATPYLRGRVDAKGLFYVFPADLKAWAQGKGGSSAAELPPRSEPLPSRPPSPVPLPLRPEAVPPPTYEPPSGCDDLNRLSTVSIYQLVDPRTGEHVTTTNTTGFVPYRADRPEADKHHTIHREEGRIFSTGMLQPAGTLPLYEWHAVQEHTGPGGSAVRDHVKGFVSSSPTMAGSHLRLLPVRGGARAETEAHAAGRGRFGLWWEFQGIAGYALATGCPGTVPLYGWYKEDLDDYLATTDPAWAGRIGDRREGYQLIRLEGYVMPAH